MLCDTGIVPPVGDAIPSNAAEIYSSSNYVTVRYLHPCNPPRPPSRYIYKLEKVRKMKRAREKKRGRNRWDAWKFTMLYSGDVYTVEVGPP